MKSEIITVSIPVTIINRLELKSKQLDIDMSVLVRQCIRRYFEKPKPIETSKSNNVEKFTFRISAELKKQINQVLLENDIIISHFVSFCVNNYLDYTRESNLSDSEFQQMYE